MRQLTSIDCENNQQLSEKLEESEARFRRLFENSIQNIGIYEVIRDENGEVEDLITLDANPSLERELGMSLESLKGKRLTDLFGIDASAHVIDKSRRIMSSGEGEQFEIFIPWANRFFMASYFPLDNDRLAVVTYDITERKNMEEALKESEAKFSRAFHGTVAAVAISRLTDGMFIDANNRWLKLHGMTRDEMINHTSLELNIWVDPEDRKEFIRKVEKNGFFNEKEMRLRRKNGEIWIALISAQVFELGGEKVILTSLIDITSRNQAEEALFSSQQMLQLVLDSIPNRVFWKDLNLNYLGCNKTAARDAGLTDPSDIVGKNDYELAWRDSAPSYREDDRQVMESGVPKTNYEERQIQHDGSTLWLKTSKVPLRNNDERVIGVLGTYEDITEQKKMEEELKRSNEELQQFAYVASHDLREPLRMIESYLDLLQNRYEGKLLDEKAKEFIGFATEGAERMQQMINDLLAYSRVETRGKAFSLASMDEVLTTALNDLKVSIKENRASITYDDLPSIMADKSQMVVLLENLISNAIKYRGAANPRIHVSVDGKVREWIFSVKDDGIGIPRDEQDRIFQMFQRLHTKEEYPGTGIGLAIAKRIVERHGGTIWVESEEGKGSTFFFTIPK